jgi:S1-C subfamily serine protease
MLRLNRNATKASASLLILLFAMGLLVGGLAIFYVNYRQSNSLSKQVSDLQTLTSSLQSQVSTLTGSQNISVTNQTISINQNGTVLADLYANVSASIVMVQGDTSTGSVQGSGFIYDYSGKMVVITNFHVVFDTTGLSVTFSDGHAYSAVVLGNDTYADLAVLSVAAPASELKPIGIASSSSLRVGDEVIAIGNPYGLVGSLTTGVVSALGRSITEDFTNFSIANIIQTSTPINPGNSGGPLLNAVGNVVGMTTAIVTDSQGLGFAIPSNTILRELSSLITTGTYTSHSYLGVFGGDMTYNLTQTLGVDVTYGFILRGGVVSNGPSDGKLQTDDIIIALNTTTIRNNDDLASYLEAKTLPGDTLVIAVVRNKTHLNVDVVLGTRPPPEL